MSLHDVLVFAYLPGWCAATLAAVLCVAYRPGDFELLSTDYRRHLFQHWKVTTFVVATIGLTVIAPWTGDPTWDYVDALFMSVLTFLSAPWSVGTLVRFMRRQTGLRQALVALCAMLFSASWSYDGYLLWRDGSYPVTWAANLIASGLLYVLAGLLWSLEWRAVRGVTFAFLEDPWFEPGSRSRFGTLLPYALPIMAVVSAAIGYFLL